MLQPTSSASPKPPAGAATPAPRTVVAAANAAAASFASLTANLEYLGAAGI